MEEKGKWFLNLFQDEGLTEDVVESAELRAKTLSLVRELIYSQPIFTHLLLRL